MGEEFRIFCALLQSAHSKPGIYPMALPVWQNPGPTGVRLGLGALILLVCQQDTAIHSFACFNRLWYWDRMLRPDSM